MATLSLEDRKRRSRNIVFASFILLIVIWTVKLSFPESTLLPNYASQSPSQSSLPTSKPPSEPESDGRWRSKPGDKLILTSDVPFNGTISNKAAVIIESRYRTNIIPLILHFNSVLGPSWPILIYTSPESIGGFSSSAALQRYIQQGAIQIRILPQTVLFTNSDSINEFMMSNWLWESLEPAEHIFIFQSDSMICANAARSVEDYFEYDFVGAPLSRKGYNGGLSLRKRSSILRVLENFDWEEMKIAEVEEAKKEEEAAKKKEEEFNKKVEAAKKKGLKAPEEPKKEKEKEKEKLFEDQWYYDRYVWRRNFYLSRIYAKFGGTIG
jgi:hypothetical protein